MGRAASACYYLSTMGFQFSARPFVRMIGLIFLLSPLVGMYMLETDNFGLGFTQQTSGLSSLRFLFRYALLFGGGLAFFILSFLLDRNNARKGGWSSAVLGVTVG